jgi:sugar lactone lactonase YvrE
MHEVVCIAPLGDRCGEAPLWHAEQRALYWADVNRGLIHRYDEATASVRSWLFDEAVTALALTNRDDYLAVALASRVIVWRPATNERMDQGFYLPGAPAVRLNDGRADPRGSFWIGSMYNNLVAGAVEEPLGVLYRLDADGAVAEMLHGITISNTLCWSPDRTRFYFADTPTNSVRVFPYNAMNGALGDGAPWFEGFARGLPDGSAMDSAGYLWNCRWGGGCLVRVAPDGQIARVVEVPALQVTSCTFGGADLCTLYITTATGDGAAGADRLAGSLFALRVEAPGLPENRFAFF